jgi:hypothetical protein
MQKSDSAVHSTAVSNDTTVILDSYSRIFIEKHPKQTEKSVQKSRVRVPLSESFHINT